MTKITHVYNLHISIVNSTHWRITMYRGYHQSVLVLIAAQQIEVYMILNENAFMMSYSLYWWKYIPFDSSSFFLSREWKWNAKVFLLFLLFSLSPKRQDACCELFNLNNNFINFPQAYSSQKKRTKVMWVEQFNHFAYLRYFEAFLYIYMQCRTFHTVGHRNRWAMPAIKIKRRKREKKNHTKKYFYYVNLFAIFFW